jgi:type II secretory pathway component PulK
MDNRDLQRRRGGAVLVVILACLAMATAISVVVVRQIAAERRTVLTYEHGLQALWLAEGGIERAVARLAADPKYAGETWAVPAGELAADDGAVVRIQVEAVAGRPEQRSVRSEADYGGAGEFHYRKVKQILVDRDVILSNQTEIKPTKSTH